MSKFAANTEVSAERSRGEIERLLMRYGASGFMYGWDDNDKALVMFRMNSRHIKFVIAMPRKDAFRLTPGRRQTRSPEQQVKEWEQATRQRWRALALVIKAKLEAVESGITSFEDEFLSATVLPDGNTVGNWAKLQIDDVYATGQMPKLIGVSNES